VSVVTTSFRSILSAFFSVVHVELHAVIKLRAGWGGIGIIFWVGVEVSLFANVLIPALGSRMQFIVPEDKRDDYSPIAPYPFLSILA
jgi:hypothetical protein